MQQFCGSTEPKVCAEKAEERDGEREGKKRNGKRLPYQVIFHGKRHRAASPNPNPKEKDAGTYNFDPSLTNIDSLPPPKNRQTSHQGKRSIERATRNIG